MSDTASDTCTDAASRYAPLAFAFLQFDGIRVRRRAGPENPADHDPNQQHAGDVDEVCCAWHQVRPLRLSSESSREISFVTELRRRESESTYAKSASTTKMYAVTSIGAAGSRSSGGSSEIGRNSSWGFCAAPPD